MVVVTTTASQYLAPDVISHGKVGGFLQWLQHSRFDCCVDTAARQARSACRVSGSGLLLRMCSWLTLLSKYVHDCWPEFGTHSLDIDRSTPLQIVCIHIQHGSRCAVWLWGFADDMVPLPGGLPGFPAARAVSKGLESGAGLHQGEPQWTQLCSVSRKCMYLIWEPPSAVT